MRDPPPRHAFAGLPVQHCRDMQQGTKQEGGVNLNMIVNMILRQLLRRGVGAGINAALGAARGRKVSGTRVGPGQARGSTAAPEHRLSDKAATTGMAAQRPQPAWQEKLAREAGRRAQQAMRAGRMFK